TRHSPTSDGSMTSSAPKKSRIGGQAAGILIDQLRGWGKGRARQRVRRARRLKIPEPVQGVQRGCSAGNCEPSVPSMSEVTRILSATEQGDPHAASQLWPLVYDELRKLAAQKLAHERPGQTLQPTALVHEAYLRLFGEGEAQHWDNRRHFFAAAAEAMRRILV